MNDTRPLAILLMGPTAAGKTDLAIALRECLGGELISVDSAMIYRDMDIGTAKPSADELARAPHRLIDIRDPAETYSAAEFREDALAEMRDISSQGRIPILVGGTMMYIKRLIDGVAELPARDPALREELAQRARHEGLGALHEELSQIDPVAARTIHPHNRQRLMRALEVYRLTGRALGELWAEQPRETFPWRLVSIALAPTDRRVLHARIAQRFESMLAGGFREEVAALRARGDLHPGLPAIRCVGYRQMWEHLNGETDEATMRERGMAATRQLAKRQLTWLRNWQGVQWIDSETTDMREQVLKIVRGSGT
ncbi:tRNA (adenosine(37)-N6)-dimethylallyltransferase MiaA [Chromohalobacter sp. HP20-39]|uniref:tRNA (adenosine(37)-N6)-dimethylallyltransferase MiaA n=1 Tax=Chromohalobacter sp. HP20-39 TaxID=3079306 RepID=UPI00294B1469|nr:tRNA (adenosine(37)-N6)-dimethylallyltransferase MiaA [Chromohalobacter sp. HP20-39]MDV6320347.1 tRNA (adenosine(37)-N6)-dimethylallyltransferase MiaA [Chromohalobacter sp. HP20-39]